MPLAQKIVIYGTRGFAREVHQLITDASRTGAKLDCVGFLVDAKYREHETVHDLPVFGDATWLARAPGVQVAIGIGATAPRHRIARWIEQEFGQRFVLLQHPRAYIGDRVLLGPGSIVCPGAVVTTDIAIGRHVQLHAGCTIGHDALIADYATIAPGANVSGRTVIGEGTFVGVGAVILPDVKVGRWSLIGAGAVVRKDVPDNVTVVGVPARVIAQRESGWHLADP